MYSEKQKTDIINEICRLIAEEGMSLRKAVIKNNTINRKTFFDWIDKDEYKSNQYARATEDRADLIFEGIFEIADDQENDVYIDKDGIEQTNHNVINRSKLRIDSRKWILSKMIPKKYGDKSTLALEGGEKPIEISFED